MDATLISRAIKSALAQNWKEAIRLNQDLIELKSDDVAALNRLAYAYLKSGNITSAKTVYKRVLKIDKYNPIALKNLKWLTNLTRKDISQDLSVTPSPTIFLEEPGKTKIVTLVYPAPVRTLCNVMTAQQVILHSRRHSIEIRNNKGDYLGALPDDLSHRLIKLIAAGNTYDAYVKNVEKNTVVVFIRELKRSKKYAQLSSFPFQSGINPLILPRPTETETETETESDEFN